MNAVVRRNIFFILTVALFFSASSASQAEPNTILINESREHQSTTPEFHPIASNFIIQAPKTTTNVTQVTDENWPKTACPTTPVNCPTINTPADSPDPTTCPAVCNVTQTNPSPTVVNASCPAGYTQIGMYNAQPEYAYTDQTVTQVPRTMAELNHWTDLQYNCTGTGPEQRYYSACSGGLGNDHSKQWDYQQFTDVMPGAANQVVYLDRYPFQRCSTSNSDCSDAFKIDCGTSGEWQWRYWFRSVTCSRPPGNYPTGRYIPGSVACARLTPTWGAS